MQQDEIQEHIRRIREGQRSARIIENALGGDISHAEYEEARVRLAIVEVTNG